MPSIVVTKQDLQTKTLLYQCSTRKFCNGAEAFATTLRTRLQACYREFSKEGTPTHDFKSAPQGKSEPTKSPTTQPPNLELIFLFEAGNACGWVGSAAQPSAEGRVSESALVWTRSNRTLLVLLSTGCPPRHKRVVSWLPVAASLQSPS